LVGGSEFSYSNWAVLLSKSVKKGGYQTKSVKELPFWRLLSLTSRFGFYPLRESRVRVPAGISCVFICVSKLVLGVCLCADC